MNETAVYSLLTALILLCYLSRCVVEKSCEAECMHDFVHILADHPILRMVLTNPCMTTMKNRMTKKFPLGKPSSGMSLESLDET